MRQGQNLCSRNFVMEEKLQQTLANENKNEDAKSEEK